MNPTTIMTASHAVAGGAMNTTTPSTLELKIKRWVELDNKIKSTAEEVRDIRTEKSVINDEILEIIEEKQLGKATVNISDGKLKFVNSKSTAPLTLTYIEKCLSELITNGKQVEQIMSYIKKNRETKTTMEIKRVYNKKTSVEADGDESSENDD
jgi:hypothetical protein